MTVLATLTGLGLHRPVQEPLLAVLTLMTLIIRDSNISSSVINDVINPAGLREALCAELPTLLLEKK